MSNSIHTYPYELVLKVEPHIPCSIDIYYKYIEGQECQANNRWEDSIPGVAPEIIWQGIKVRKLPDKQWFDNPEKMAMLNTTVLHHIQDALADDDSELTLALIDYAKGEPYE